MAGRKKKSPPPTVITLVHEESVAEILLRAGGTVGALRLRGRNVLAAPEVSEFEKDYTFRASLDTFAGNLYLNAGFAVPLFPVAGHLPARPLGLDLGEAELDGRRLPVPLNLNREHWHGLAYLARAEVLAQELNRAHLRLPAGFFGPYWTGQVQLDLHYELSETFTVAMRATNIGPTPSPVTFGVRLALDGKPVRAGRAVRAGGFEITGDPLARVDLENGIMLASPLVQLDTDASATFTWTVSPA